MNYTYGLRHTSIQQRSKVIDKLDKDFIFCCSTSVVVEGSPLLQPVVLPVRKLARHYACRASGLRLSDLLKKRKKFGKYARKSFMYCYGYNINTLFLRKVLYMYV